MSAWSGQPCPHCRRSVGLYWQDEVGRCNNCGTIADIRYPTAAERERFRAACDGDDPAVAIAGALAQPAKLACLTEAQQQKAWAEWHDSKVYQDLLRDMAAGEVEFGVALATAFIAGITAKAGP